MFLGETSFLLVLMRVNTNISIIRSVTSIIEYLHACVILSISYVKYVNLLLKLHHS